MDLTQQFPIIPHRLVGVECRGRLIPKSSDDNSLLLCSVCGKGLGTMDTVVLTELVNMISGRASDRYLEIMASFDINDLN